MEELSVSRRRLLAAVPTSTALFAGCTSLASLATSRSKPFSVLGWYPGWGRYNDTFLPEDVPFDRLDELYYANLSPSADGTVVFSSPNDEPNLAELRDLKQEGEPGEDVRMGFAVGGWNSSKHYSDAALTQKTRTRFAETAIEKMRTYDFDGFEIDWEYPTGQGRQQNVTRDVDVENVVKLVEECRAQLDEAMAADDRTYTLSYSAPYQPEYTRALDVSAIADLVDYIDLMTYDMVDESSPVTSHNAPLYGSPSIDQAVRTWESAGMPRSKMMVGQPFYGYRFDGVPPGPNGDGLGQPFDTFQGTLTYEGVRTRRTDSSWTRYWDGEAKAPYLYNPASDTWVSSTGTKYVETATAYALSEGCRGVHCWELEFASGTELLDAINETIPPSATP